ncbi:efflux transporter outer membrane subunit [Massilia niastensis]|uniref:efflux transporter outer membrane subunit n=1 Tax=Massilia niastensis TaxID=544911 RepID=UPI0003A8A435|nr:efflux transporter outer membrane subunit [Massilia niastensis]
MNARLPAALALLLTLAGCMSTGPQGERARLRDAAAAPSQGAIAALALPDAAWPAQEWWRAYGDPQLDALVRRARSDSPTVAIALARVRQAAALEGVANAALGPQASASARSSRQRFSENSTVPRPLAGSWNWFNDASVGLSYELDFWGKNRSAVDAAAGRVNAQKAEAEAAALAVTVAVVQAWFRLDLLHQQHDLARTELRQREQILELVGKRVEAELDSQAELRQAEIGVPVARGQIAALDEAIALTRGQLAALAGQGQDAAGAIGRPQLRPSYQPGVPADLPAALLGRRPELVALRWRVEAASGDIDVARAQFYPTVNLAALVGLQSLGFDRLLQGGSATASAGPLVTLPLFDGGRLRSNLAARNAEYDIAVEQYNAAVVEAMRDVVAQLTSIRAQETRLREQDLALAAAEQAYSVALQRYRGGLATFLQVLVADGQVVAQRRARADLAARANELDLNLVRALGGGH